MLSLINNISALNAQNNLTNANMALSTSLQRLSSGLRINSGADDPAGLVISQLQQAQMSGLQTAISNTSADVNVVQTADGGLNEINALLVQIRGLAVAAANQGANDSGMVQADQAQITNALATINGIANTTRYGQDVLLDGSHDSTAGGTALTFQIGANGGSYDSTTLNISSMQTNALGTGVTNASGITDLAGVDVTKIGAATNAQSSSDILAVIDKAISQVATQAGALGAFQDNTLQATAANLQTSLQNTTAANSTIRDTNFAVESANFAQNQVLVQAGTQVLKNANQLPGLVLTLLQ